MKVKFPDDHPLRAWAVIHGAWLLNRYHISSSTGTTAFMSLRGRPYREKVCAFGEEVFALDPLQAKYSTQWRRGIWLTKDSADMDVFAVSEKEVIRSRAIRKVAEHWNSDLALAFNVGPWDLRRGVYTEVKHVNPPEAPIPLLHAPIGGVEPEFDEDEKAVRKYAEENPMEDLEEESKEVERSETGGAQVIQPDHHGEQQPLMDDGEPLSQAKRQAADVRLPIPVRQRVAEAEALKRSQHAGEEGQKKFVKFDPETVVMEPSPKQPRTSLYSPTYAGDIASSPATSSTTRNVRRIVEDIELYDEDELECNMADDSFDYELCETQLDFEGEKVMIPEDEKQKRGFFDEGAGPPKVTEDELAWLDQEAMEAELERLRKLDVIEDAGNDLVVENCMKLDTRLVRDWRFRENQWRRRARLVAREFRDGDASNYETFSPTTPLAIVKMLIVMSLLHGLAIASIDVGDAFLQVPQTSLVLIEVPLWALRAGGGEGKQFWVLKRCLPGQRVAASEWNKFFTEICERHQFESYQGTIFKHRNRRPISQLTSTTCW